MKGVIRAFVLFSIPIPAILADSQTARTLTKQGDDLYSKRADLTKAKEALEKYQQALASGEDAYEVYWRMAMVEYRIANQTPGKAEKMRILEIGIYHAKKAVQLAPERPESHYWLGVNIGIYGESKGVRKGLSIVKPIKEEMNEVLAIDPSFANGGADRILGRVYYKLPEQAGGSKLRSLKHLLKSKEYGPRVALTRIYLADTYLALNELQKARDELEFVIAIELDPNLIPETAEEKELARKKLEKLDPTPPCSKGKVDPMR
jgi:tetratricopeptide (TPR) repeat protein